MEQNKKNQETQITAPTEKMANRLKSGIGRTLDSATLILLFLMVLVYEYALTHNKWIGDNKTILNAVTCILFVLLIIHIIRGKKDILLLKSFVNAHHGESYHLTGLVNLVFVFSQLHLLGTEIHTLLVPHGEAAHSPLFSQSLQLLTYVALLFLPFLLIVIFTRQAGPVPKEEREVLVTSISLPKKENIINVINKKFEKGFIKSDGGNLRPIIKAIEAYSNLKKVLLFIDEKAYAEFYAATRETDFLPEGSTEDPVSLFFNQFIHLYSENAAVELLRTGTFNKMNSIFKDQKRLLEAKLYPYKNRKIVFSLTNGTAAVSAALTLLSIRGERGLCYLTQGEQEEILEFDVSVTDLQDIISNFLSGHSHS